MATDPIPLPPAPSQAGPARTSPAGATAAQATEAGSPAQIQVHPAWNWRTALPVCAVLLAVGISADLDLVWLVAVSVGLLAFIGSSASVRADTHQGPGAVFVLLLLAAVMVTTVAVWIIWLLLELDLTATAGLFAGCLVILAAIPMARRRIAASG